MLFRSATLDNLGVQQLFGQAQQWAIANGQSFADAQRLAMQALYKQMMMTSAVMSFQDVFRVVSILTLFAIIPAAFLRVRKRPATREAVAHAMGE